MDQAEMELRLVKVEKLVVRYGNELHDLHKRLETLDHKIEGLTSRLLDHEIGEPAIRIRSEATYPTTAWLLPASDDPTWAHVRDARVRIAMSAVRAGLVPAIQPGETIASYERRTQAFCESQIKTNPEFQEYVTAAGTRDPWAWPEGLAALAEEMNGEPSQFVSIMKRRLTHERGRAVQPD